MKHAMDLNARSAMLQIVKAGLMLSFAGLAALSATACELVEPLLDDNVEQPHDGDGDGDDKAGGDPQDWPDVSPECKKAEEEYLLALSAEVPFADEQTYAHALQTLYRNALATCGEGKVPLPLPIPGDLPGGEGGSGGSSCEDGEGGHDGEGGSGGGGGSDGAGGSGGAGGVGGGAGGHDGYGGKGGRGGYGGGSGGTGGGDVSPECEKAIDLYVRALLGATGPAYGESSSLFINRIYEAAIKACGEGSVPPPPAG